MSGLWYKNLRIQESLMDSQDTNTMKNITTLHMVVQEQQTTQCTLPEPNLSPSLKDNTPQDKEIVLSWILSE